jgi:hypothetical protein
MAPKLSRHVICGRENAPSRASAHPDGFALKRRIIAHFDRCIEAVHIDVDDFALRIHDQDNYATSANKIKDDFFDSALASMTHHHSKRLRDEHG